MMNQSTTAHSETQAQQSISILSLLKGIIFGSDNDWDQAAFASDREFRVLMSLVGFAALTFGLIVHL